MTIFGFRGRALGIEGELVQLAWTRMTVGQEGGGQSDSE